MGNFLKPIVFLILGILGLAQSSAWAERETWRQNTALLPEYCKDRAQGREQFEKWRRVLGTAYNHTHHYCSGIYSELKAKGTADRRERNRFLGKVAQEMSYVSRHCQAGCVLYPELHTRWGWALGDQGQVSEAIQHYQLAIQAKPTHTSAYSGLSKLYLETGQPEEARKVLKAGLKAKPNSKALQRRLEKLEKTE